MSKANSNKAKQAKQARILESLADWLLDDSISFSKLDRFRRDLGIESDVFARILGIKPANYANWKRKGVSLKNRNALHSSVLSYAALVGTLVQVFDASNQQIDAELGGLQGAKNILLGFSSRTQFFGKPGADPWEDAGLFIPLQGNDLANAKASHKANFFAELRQKHAGADEPCGCAICGGE